MTAEESAVMHSEIGDKGLFVMKREGKRMGILEYKRISGTVISAFHTKVESEFEGQGVAKVLFGELISWARENEQRIIPACSFVRTMFERNPEVQSLKAD